MNWQQQELAPNPTPTPGRSARKIEVSFVLPSFAGGGAERVMLTLLSSLDRSRFNPRLIVLHGRGPLASCAPADVPVLDLNRARVRSAFPSLTRTLRQFRPDVIVSTMGYLNLAVLAAAAIASPDSRVIVREANAPQATLDATPSWLTRMAYRALYPRAAAILCPTHSIASALMESFALPVQRTILLPNPVNEAQLRRSAAPTIRHPGLGPRFVMAGRLTRQKGWDRIIDMFARLPDQGAHLTILGDGPDRPALEAAVAAKGLLARVAVLGHVDEPWRYYAGADALLIASRWEGMPNVALEALALGVPVIATPDSGGVIELAAETEPGVVTLADVGDAYIAALMRVRTRANTFGPPLLPGRFALRSVSEQLADVITGA